MAIHYLVPDSTISNVGWTGTYTDLDEEYPVFSGSFGDMMQGSTSPSANATFGMSSFTMSTGEYVSQAVLRVRAGRGSSSVFGSVRLISNVGTVYDTVVISGGQAWYSSANLASALSGLNASAISALRFNATVTGSFGNTAPFIVSLDVINLQIQTAFNTPAPTVNPVVTGIAQAGRTLTCSQGTWTDASTYARQWKRSGSSISGATNSTYTLTSADVDRSITCTVTSSNAGQSGTYTPAAVIPFMENSVRMVL